MSQTTAIAVIGIDIGKNSFHVKRAAIADGPLQHCSKQIKGPN